MNEETLRLAKEGLASLLKAVEGQALAPDRLAVIEAAKFGIMVAENRSTRGPRLINRPWYRMGVRGDDAT